MNSLIVAFVCIYVHMYAFGKNAFCVTCIYVHLAIMHSVLHAYVCIHIHSASFYTASFYCIQSSCILLSFFCSCILRSLHYDAF